jgi:hypothetical protein
MRVAPCPTAAAVQGTPADHAVANSRHNSSSSSSNNRSSTGPVVLFPGETFSVQHIPFSFQDSEVATRVSELYVSLPSLQTSRCPSAGQTGESTCWVEAEARGVKGWLPVAQGVFYDSKCRGFDWEPLQEFVTDDCGCECLSCFEQCLPML